MKTEIPEQRIVSDDLWQRAKARRDVVSRVYFDANKGKGLLRSSSMNAPYLFSGLLKCSECGANMTILWGKGRNKTIQSYGCPMNWNRGETVCKNTVRIRRDTLEAMLLGSLQEKVMRDEAVDYVMERFEKELRKALESIGGEMEAIRQRKAQLEKEIGNLLTGLATGIQSAAVMGEIAKREREISDISDKLLSSKPDSVHSRIQRMSAVAKVRIKDCAGFSTVTWRLHGPRC